VNNIGNRKAVVRNGGGRNLGRLMEAGESNGGKHHYGIFTIRIGERRGN